MTDRELMQEAMVALDEILGWHTTAPYKYVEIAKGTALRLRARLAQPELGKRVKCDGNHGGPACADPECWLCDEPSEQTAPAKTRIELTEIPDAPPAPQGVPMFTPPPKLLPIGSVPAKADGQWSEHVMRQWDYWRQEIANGDTSSAPRDWFESLAPAPVAKAEPVAWMDPQTGEVCRDEWREENAREQDRDRFSQPLYLAPPVPDAQRESEKQALIDQGKIAMRDFRMREIDALRESHARLVATLEMIATADNLHICDNGYTAIFMARQALAAAKEVK